MRCRLQNLLLQGKFLTTLCSPVIGCQLSRVDETRAAEHGVVACPSQVCGCRISQTRSKVQHLQAVSHMWIPVPMPQVFQLRHVPGLFFRWKRRQVQKPQNGPSNARILHNDHLWGRHARLHQTFEEQVQVQEVFQKDLSTTAGLPPSGQRWHPRKRPRTQVQHRKHNRGWGQRLHVRRSPQRTRLRCTGKPKPFTTATR